MVTRICQVAALGLSAPRLWPKSYWGESHKSRSTRESQEETRKLSVGKRLAEVLRRLRHRFTLGGIENLAAIQALAVFLVLVFCDKDRVRVFAGLRRHRQMARGLIITLAER